MNQRTTNTPLSALLPHAAPMILIDKVLSYTDDSLTAQVTIRPDSLFLNADHTMPCWVGIEYMAQSIAAWSGALAHERGDPVRIGFLLGSRRYRSTVAHFKQGSTLIIQVDKTFQDNAMGVFNGTIYCNDEKLVEADIKTYQPANPDSLKDISA